MQKIVNGKMDVFVDWFDTDGNVINASDGDFSCGGEGFMHSHGGTA